MGIRPEQKGEISKLAGSIGRRLTQGILSDFEMVDFIVDVD